MPFALTDLKRAYGRSGVRAGPPDVRPYLLAGAELAAQMPKLRAAIAWHEAQCGRRRAEIDLDELAQVVGDYRLARCLGACLQGTYRYAADDFEAAVVGEGGPGGRARWTCLQERGVASPSALRLHVYDRVQAARGGFVPPAERQEVMASVAADLLLDPEHLDRLMRLDAEENERLTRLEPPPSPEGLAAEYNRRALATLLGRAISADLLLPQPDGAALRRFYFLVKRNGLLCELSLPQPAHLIPNPSPRSAPVTASPSPSRGEGDAAGRPRTKTPPRPWRERG